MWDLDQLVRQNDQAALDWMMKGCQVDEAQSPQPPAWALAMLADKLKVGPPALDQIIEYLLSKDTAQAFLTMIREFLPEHESQIMSEPRHRRIYRFVHLFGKKYYPLPANTDCPVSAWVAGMPVELLAMSYYGYHELDMRPGYLLLLSLVVYPYEGDERDLEDDSVPFNPLELPREKYRPSARDIQWVKDLVQSLAVEGEWIAPMGFRVVKVAENKIELRQANDTPEVKETIRRTLLIAKKAGIEAEFSTAGRTSEEKMNAARVPLLDKVESMVGAGVAGRIRPAGWFPDELHRITDKTKYDGVGEFADWACSQTGCVMLDTAFENCEWVEGEGEPVFKWTRNNVDMLTEQWPKVQRIRDKIDHMVEWLEANQATHFQELLDHILKCEASSPRVKRKRVRSFDPFEHMCPLDQVGEEEEDDEQYARETVEV